MLFEKQDYTIFVVDANEQNLPQFKKNMSFYIENIAEHGHLTFNLFNSIEFLIAMSCSF